MENVSLSVDPLHARRMIDRRSYTPPFQVGEALTGGAIGHGMTITSATIDAYDPGIVNARFSIR